MVVVFSHGFKKLTEAECRSPKAADPILGLDPWLSFSNYFPTYSIGVHKFCGQMISWRIKMGVANREYS